MSNRTAIVASAVIAGCVSIFSITSLSVNTARAATDDAPAASEEAPAAKADECLAGPKGTTPAGAHWYYRIQKGAGRKCWYLGDEGAKVKKPAETASSPAAEEDAPPPKKKPMQKSVANARAELTTGSTDEDPALAASTWPPLPPSADAAVRDDNQTASIQPSPQPAAPQGWDIASRWPEPKTTASADNQPNTVAQPAPALTPDRLVMATATPAPTATPVAAAQPDKAAHTGDASPDDATFSIRIMLSVLVCALALAAIIGPMIFKYIRPRPRKDDRAYYGQRRPIWDMDTPHETVRQDNPRSMSRTYGHYVDAPPEPRVLDEAVDELEELLARASRRPAA
ncbi:hypothetical protein BH10PSE10_BH10PSE10_21160 [soil metagenome]